MSRSARALAERSGGTRDRGRRHCRGARRAHREAAQGGGSVRGADARRGDGGGGERSRAGVAIAAWPHARHAPAVLLHARVRSAAALAAALVAPAAHSTVDVGTGGAWPPAPPALARSAVDADASRVAHAHSRRERAHRRNDPCGRRLTRHRQHQPRQSRRVGLLRTGRSGTARGRGRAAERLRRPLPQSMLALQSFLMLPAVRTHSRGLQVWHD